MALLINGTTDHTSDEWCNSLMIGLIDGVDGQKYDWSAVHPINGVFGINNQSYECSMVWLINGRLNNGISTVVYLNSGTIIITN